MLLEKHVVSYEVLKWLIKRITLDEEQISLLHEIEEERCNPLVIAACNSLKIWHDIAVNGSRAIQHEHKRCVDSSQ